MRVDHIGAAGGVELRPVPAVVQRPGSGVEFGDQFGDRPGLVRGRVEPGVVDLQEDPLGPLVEVDVGGGEAAPRVVAETQPPELAAEVDDVGLGAGARMRAGLHRVLLGRQAEGVEAQRVQHIAAGHPVVPGVDVGRDVAQRVTDVQALARRVGEHVLDEHLVGGHRGAVGGRQRTDRVGHVEGPRLQPTAAATSARCLPPAPRCSGASGCRRQPRAARTSARARTVFQSAFRSRHQGISTPIAVSPASGLVSVPLRMHQGLVPGRLQAWLLRDRRGYSRRLTREWQPRTVGEGNRRTTGDERNRPPLAGSGSRHRHHRGRCGGRVGLCRRHRIGPAGDPAAVATRRLPP